MLDFTYYAPTKVYFGRGEQSCIDKLTDLCTYSKTRVVESWIELDYDNIKMIFESCF